MRCRAGSVLVLTLSRSLTHIGYVGYDEGGQLTDAVRRKPYSVLLFDEMEKAHPGTSVNARSSLRVKMYSNLSFSTRCRRVQCHVANPWYEQTCFPVLVLFLLYAIRLSVTPFLRFNIDDGRVTDSKGNIVNFKNCVIIFTSNVGSQDILDLNGSNEAGAQEIMKERVTNAMKEKFRPGTSMESCFVYFSL